MGGPDELVQRCRDRIDSSIINFDDLVISSNVLVKLSHQLVMELRI